MILQPASMSMGGVNPSTLLTGHNYVLFIENKCFLLQPSCQHLTVFAEEYWVLFKT